MAQTVTISVPNTFEAKVAPNTLSYSIIEDILFSSSPEELVFLALRRLSQLDIDFVEFRRPLYARMNLPVVVVNHTYLVSDDALAKAEHALSHMGLPIEQSPTYPSSNYDGFSKTALLFRLTKSIKCGQAQFLELLPASFASFLPSELESSLLQPPFRFSHFNISPVKLLVPTVPATYASLLRIIARYPKSSNTRTHALSDLGELLEYHLMGMDSVLLDEDGMPFVDDATIQASLDQIRTWARTKAFHYGEEWMGDALGALLEGRGRFDLLPWSNPPFE